MKNSDIIKYNKFLDSNTFFNGLSTPVLLYPNLLTVPGIVHGSSTRLGGVSGDAASAKGDASTNFSHLSSLNLSFKCGDDPDNVKTNYHRFCDSADIPYDSVTFSAQTHTTNIRVVTQEDRGKGLSSERDYEDVDALITNINGIALTVFSADCVPILFAERSGRAIGAAHCGWKGTYGLLQQKMILQFKTLYGIEPQDIMVAICPAIHGECYEVDEVLWNKFRDLLTLCACSEPEITSFCGKLPPEKTQYGPEHSGLFVDLPLINQSLLEKAGVPVDNIFVSSLCTSCHSDILFSHRASKGKRGLMASMIEIV